MENNLIALNNYLFEQIERLSDDSLSAEDIDRQIERSDCIVKVSKTILDNAALALKTQQHLDEYGYADKVAIPLLGIGNEKV